MTMADTEKEPLMGQRNGDPLVKTDRSDIIKPTSPVGTASWFVASLILANIVLGSGLLNYPNAYKDAGGLLNMFFIQAVALVAVQLGIVLIAYCSDLAGQCTYQDVVRDFTGQYGLFVVNVLIIIHDFGSCVTYLIIVADQIDQVVVYIYGPTYCHVWYLNRYFTLTTVSVLFILPFCFPRTITSYRFASALGVLATVYLFVLVIYKYFALEGEPSLDDVVIKTSMDTWSDIFKVLPAVVFSFDAHIESVPLYASLRRRGMPELVRTLISSTIICVVVYNMVGAFGYLTYGQFVNTDILTNYYPLDVPTIIGLSMVAFKTILTYPVVFFCARLVVMDVFGVRCGRQCGWGEPVQRISITIIMFAISVLLALVVPNIGTVISLLGGTSALFIFFFPGLCFFKAHLWPKTTQDHLKRALGALFIIIGAFLLGTTTAQSIMSYIAGDLAETDVKCTT